MSPTVAQRLASRQTRRRPFDWSLVGLGAVIVALALAAGLCALVALVWLASSIVELANGHPATLSNVLGLILPTLLILSVIFGRGSK
ncbi:MULTISPECIES: hypothetical protein [unclassified Microbacterium]|uniref:hypothetical protein n=1 Tax=unclassified Microbacterium TaxID=2609290 RepID=UPI000EAA03C8|nr:MULTISPECIES: hypothetical protein [unclassified Microbacterium]MBT2484777.1 hypothetical protein [Microbacterium sp. ISL-108]RKN67653.1 hypothetical protein D7252_08695 [Microbacterium sp. CGR2]